MAYEWYNNLFRADNNTPGTTAGMNPNAAGMSENVGGAGMSTPVTPGTSGYTDVAAANAAESGPSAKGKGFKKSEKAASALSQPSGQAPFDPIPQINDLASIIAAMGGGFMGGMAEGGQLRPGESAVVGEAGAPEVVQAQPGGGAVVTPTAAPATPGGLNVPGLALPGLKGVLAKIAIGLAGPEAVATGHAQAGQYRQQLAQMAQTGVQNPMLLESPNVASAVDSLYGAGTSQRILDAGNPEKKALAIGKQAGVKFLVPGTQLPDGSSAPGYSEQLRAAAAGNFGLKYDSKGNIAVTTPTPSYQDVGARRVWATFQAFTAAGDDDITAARKSMEAAAAQGVPVPKEIIDIGLGRARNALDAEKVRTEANIRAATELGYAGPIAAAKESAQRNVQLAKPVSEPEFLAKATKELAAAEAATATDPEAKAFWESAQGELTARQKLDVKAPPASIISKQAARVETLRAVSSVLQRFNPEKVGPIAGRMQDMKQFLGAMNVSEGDFRSSVNLLFQALRLQVTGQAAATSELNKIEKDLLSYKMGPRAFVGFLAGVGRQAALGHEATRGQLAQYNMKAPGFAIDEGTAKFLAKPGVALNPKFRHLYAQGASEDFENFLKSRAPASAQPGLPRQPGQLPTTAGNAPKAAPAPAAANPQQAKAAEILKKVEAGEMTLEQADAELNPKGK